MLLIFINLINEALRMEQNPIDLFDEWAKIGKDDGMAKAHEPSVIKILDYVYKIYKKQYCFIYTYRSITSRIHIVKC